MRVAPFAVAFTMTLGTLLGGGSARAQESKIAGLKAAVASGGGAAERIELGRALRRAGRYGEALAELHATLPATSSHPDLATRLHWEVARVYMDRHDFPRALGECRVLAAVRGAAAEGHACAADAHLVWQRATEALAETAAALAIDPGCYDAKVAEGRAYDFAIDTDRSVAAFRAAIALRPDGADAQLGLGRELLKAGSREEGIAELRKAVDLDPNGPDGLYALAVAIGPGEESLTLLERATRERPDFADAWLALGTQRLAAGRLGDARAAAEAAARNDAKDVAPHVLLGKVDLAEGRADDAMNEGRTALRILANSAAAKLLVADANAKKGEVDRALEAYQEAWGLNHGDPTALVHASEACHAAGRDTSARAFAEKATQEFPKWAPGWNALGDALTGQGEKASARDAYAKALSADGPVDREAVRRKLGAL